LSFTRTKNVGLLLLGVVSTGTVLYLYSVVGSLSDHTGEIFRDLVDTRTRVEELQGAVAEASKQFHRYRSRKRITPLALEMPVERLRQAAGELGSLGLPDQSGLGALDEAVQDVERQTRAFVEEDAREPGGKAAAERLRLAEQAVASIRRHLRPLATNVPPDRLAEGRRQLETISRLAKVLGGNLSEFASRDRIRVAEAVTWVERAQGQLGVLDEAVGRTFRSRLEGLSSQLSLLRATMLAYENDEALTASNGNVETIRRLAAESDRLEQELFSDLDRIVADLYASMEESRTHVLAEAAAGRRGALGAAVLCLVVSLAVSLALSRALSRGIQVLIEGTRRFAGGDCTHRLPVTDRDELGRLAGAFNTMAGDLEARNTELLRLEAALQQASDGIAIAEPSGFVRFANPAFHRLTGWDPATAPTRSLASLYPDEPSASEWVAGWGRAADGEVWSGRLHASRGEDRYEEFCTLSPIKDPFGRLAHVLVMKRDISREIQIEERVRESQRMQALGTLVGGVAHDFNNLLNPILVYSEMLLAKAEPESKDHVRLQRISDAAAEASALVRQILAFSRPGEESKQPLQLGPLVKDVVKVFVVGLPPGIRVELDVDAELPPVLADPTNVHQVLMNLLTNAKHAMARGGRLLCRLDSRIPDAGEVSGNPALVDRACVCLTVQDEGHGMLSEVRERIFEPFFSTKGLGEGTGMGLAVVRGIVEDHGGAIAVESEVGRGTTFRVFLPVAAPAAPAETAAELPAVQVCGTEQLLLVERSDEVREALRHATGLLGYRVEAAPDVDHALRVVRERAESFDAVIVDEAQVEVRNGSAIRRLRAAAPGLRILAACTHADRDARDRLCAAGADGTVEKPLSPQAIGLAVRNIYGNATAAEG
jgi:PAS domain S-box-containing protein